MNPNNRWIRMADRIPRDECKVKYAELFPNDTGNVAKSLRVALETLIIQTKFQYVGCELMEQIAENLCLQYFIGLPDYQEKVPVDACILVLFCKWISDEMLMEEMSILLPTKMMTTIAMHLRPQKVPAIMIRGKMIHTKGH